MNKSSFPFQSSDIVKLLDAVKKMTITTGDNGEKYITDALGECDCVRYNDNGIEFQPNGRQVNAPMGSDVLLLTTSVSLCGTDLAIIDKAQHGNLPDEAKGKVVGHEAAGIIVGVGPDVKEWQIGQVVCLDSHFACSNPAHQSFDDCVAGGASCDGIVGGIRGAMSEDGQHRHDTIDGYWSRVISVPASALTVEVPLEVAENLVAPSTLESLGNIYMIVEEMEKLGLTKNPQETLCVVSGLGATGYPMAAVASHYKFDVVGINPSPGKREFALSQGACKVAFESIDQAKAELKDYKRVVVIVTAGSKQAYLDALNFLHEAGQDENIEQKTLIAFGLFENADEPMPEAPDHEGKPIAQRNFVFSRHNFTTEDGVQVHGVCGRDLMSWKRLIKDLMPMDGVAPKLVTMLNQAQLQVKAQDPLEGIAQELNQGATHVQNMLKMENKLKLVANFFTTS